MVVFGDLGGATRGRGRSMVTAAKRISRIKGVLSISGKQENAMVPPPENLHQIVE